MCTFPARPWQAWTGLTNERCDHQQGSHTRFIKALSGQGFPLDSKLAVMTCHYIQLHTGGSLQPPGCLGSTGSPHHLNTTVAHAQVAHFLEADLHPWAAAIAAIVFPPSKRQPLWRLGVQPSDLDTTPRDVAAEYNTWQRLGELTGFDGAVDAILRAWRLPLLEQLPRTPAAWQPAVIRSRAIAGVVTLKHAEAAACSNAMDAFHGVAHTFVLDQVPADALQRTCTAIASLRDVRTLRIEEDFMYDSATVLSVAPALSHLSQLARLAIVGAGISSAGAAALAQTLRMLTALTALDLTSNAIDHRSMEALAPALAKLPQLASLRLAHNGLGHRGVGMLAPALVCLTTLTCLDLQDSSLRRAGATALAPALGRLPQLASLRLAWNHFQGSGAQQLAPALSSLLRLAHLDLSGNVFCATGAAALAPPLGLLTALTHLNLSGNSLYAAGAASLASSLARLTALQWLDVSECGLGAAGAAAAARAARAVAAVDTHGRSSEVIDS